MEVIIGRMSTGVALGSDSRTKDDQVPAHKSASALDPPQLKHNLSHALSDTRMNDKHATHRSSRIIPHPLLAIPEIRLDPRVRIPLRNTLNNILHQCRGITRVVRGVVDRQRGGDNVR